MQQLGLSLVMLYRGSFLLIMALASLAFADQVTVVSGDTLWSLSISHGTTVGELKAINSLESDAILIGMVLTLPNHFANNIPTGTKGTSHALREENTPGEITAPKRLLTDSLYSSSGVTSGNPHSGTYAMGLNTLPTADGKGLLHRVAAGESLIDIAELHYITLAAILELNRLKNDTVNPGTFLYLPFGMPLVKDTGQTVDFVNESNLLSETSAGNNVRLATNPQLTASPVKKVGAQHQTATVSSTTSMGTDPKSVGLSLYRVRLSDNLLEIALGNGTTVEHLKAVNGLTTDIVQAGVILVLPEEIQALKEETPFTQTEPQQYLDEAGTTTSEEVDANSAYTQASRDPASQVIVAIDPATVVYQAASTPGPANHIVPEGKALEAGGKSASQGNPNLGEPNKLKLLRLPAYIVKQGDTLSDIAQTNGITVNELIALNRLTSGLITPGTALDVSRPLTEPSKYRVETGESLSSIAEAHGVDLEQLLEVNRLVVGIVNPGTVLTIPPPIGKALRHIVLEGDSLYDIAIANSLAVKDLVVFNNLDGTIIHPGQELFLTSVKPLAIPLVVTVDTGDTVWEIARAHDTTVSAIAIANNLADTARIRLGDTLKIPGRSTHMSPNETAANAQTLKVQGGDTLSEIAQQYNTTVPALISTNGLASDRITIGQILNIFPGNGFRVPQTDTASAILRQTSLVWPLIGQITSRFGYRQLRVEGANWHSGLDIDGVTGDPIRAAATGVVSYSGWMGGYGNLVIIKADNTDYYYAHASVLHVSEGEWVQVGQLLAQVGATGRTTGSHLHFEVRINGDPVDPLLFLEVR
jgi:LysM repeat protein